MTPCRQSTSVPLIGGLLGIGIIPDSVYRIWEVQNHEPPKLIGPPIGIALLTYMETHSCCAAQKSVIIAICTGFWKASLYLQGPIQNLISTPKCTIKIRTSIRIE